VKIHCHGGTGIFFTICKFFSQEHYMVNVGFLIDIKVSDNGTNLIRSS
jgi:hypothetical protein